jgi:hypothetical protein
VISKTFTVDGAKKLFDRIFAGEAPPCARGWLSAVRGPDCEASKQAARL